MSFSPKPTGMIELTGAGSINSATLRAFLSIHEGAGPPRELLSNSVGHFGVGYVNSTSSGFAGGIPQWTTNGFPYATSNDKTLKFGPNMRGYIGFAGTGINSGNAGTKRTLFITFKVNTAPVNAAHTIWLLSQGTGNGDAALCLVPYVTGTNQGAGAYKLNLFMQSGYTGPSTDLIVYPGIWYTAALSQDDNGGAPNIIRNWWLYDWSAGQTYTNNQTGLSTAWYTGNSTNQLCIDIPTQQNTGWPGLLGEVYAAGIDMQSWTAGNGLFGTYVGDPIAPARGSDYSSAAGTLTASTAFVGRVTNTTVELNTARPTLGVTPYSYQWHRSATANFTPSGGTAIGGATTPAYTDTPGSAGPWYYKCQVTDSAGLPATVTCINPLSASLPQIHVQLDAAAPIVVGLIGDSITDNTKQDIARVLYAATGAPVRLYNGGVQGGVTILGNSVLSVNPGNYNLGTHGTPTGGAFTLTWNGNTTSGLAYNASASAVQTALSAFPGWSSVSCTGGPLPTSIQIRLPAALASDTNALTIGTNSLTGGSQSAPWVRSQTRLIADLTLADGGSLVTIHLGANDAATANGSAWNTACRQIVDYVNNRSLLAVLQVGVPRADTSELQTANLQDYYLTQIPAIVASVNNSAKCIAGDSTLFGLAIQQYVPSEFLEVGRIHPRGDSLGQVQAIVQAAGIMKALGLRIGAPVSYTAASNVRNGVNRGDGTTGTLVVPAAANVRSGVSYDNGTVGTYSPTYTAAANVRAGYDRGDGTIGTLVVPAAGSVLAGATFDNGTSGTATVPAAGLVLSGTPYGAGGNAATGTLALPAAGNVLSGVTYGTGGNGSTGTRTDAPIGKVRSGVTYGAGGAGLTGTDVLPTVDQVQSGVGFGTSGTEFTGTYAGGGGGGVLPSNGLDNVIVDTVDINGTPTAINVRQAISLIFAALVNDASGLGATGNLAPTFFAGDGSTPRIAATVASGNRTVLITPPA